jgi:plastocyanin
MRRLTAVLCLLGAATAIALVPGGAAVAGGGCPTGPTEGSGDTVELVKACFTPTILWVDPGTEVTFVSKDPMPHNISAYGWGTAEDMTAGDVYRAMFREDGVYPYACTYHFGMTGAIVVGDGKGSATLPVEVGSVEDALADLETPEPGSVVPDVDAGELPVDPQAATNERRGALGWALPGAIGAVVGGGTAAAVRRRRLGA